MDSYSFDSAHSSISYNRSQQPAADPRLAVRKTAPPSKPWRKPTAPLPPNPTRVYQVDRMNFRELVQKLTGAVPIDVPAPDSHPSRLHKVAPPPLDLAPALTQPSTSSSVPVKSAASTPLSSLYKELMSETWSDSSKPHKLSEISLGLGLSPSPLGWCSIPMLSPGTLSSFEPSTVL